MKSKTLRIFSALIILSILLVSCSSDDKNDEKTDSVKQNVETPGAVAKAPESIEEFYNGPVDLSTAKPGDVIYSQPLTGLDSKINGWRVLYVTTALEGNLTATSALVYAPRDEKAHKLMVWAHGTIGIADECAPSRSKDGTEKIFFFNDYISKGYAVIAPDYEGLGTPGTHPFLVGTSEGRSILDSIRMGQTFDPINPEPGAVVIGHSQGGQGVLFAGELHQSYAPDANLLGVIAVAPAGELKSLLGTASKSGGTIGFVVMGAIGFQTAYPELDITKVLTESAIEKSSIIERGCLVSVVDAFKGDINTTLSGDPTTLEPWASYLDVNSPGKTKTDVPVMFVHGFSDLTVPAFVSEKIYNADCALGTATVRKTYSGAEADHNGVLTLASKDILTFAQDRFDGKPFESGCA